MTDTLEIRPHMVAGQWRCGVFDVAKDKFVASYPDQIHAYAWAVGYLNEHIRHLKADASLVRSFALHEKGHRDDNA